jgi:signal transduction histidine kinase
MIVRQKLSLFFNGLLESGHSFKKDEVLVKFQYRVINSVLLVMGLFTFIFATLSLLGINPLGTIQTISNYLLVVASIVLIIRLRGPKSRYYQSAYLMYTAAMLAFITALLFVPHDEFRIIWFYLLVFAAYITGGLRAGNIISVISLAVVLTAHIFYDLQLSETAIISSILGLIIATLFFRAYTKKIIDFEQELTAQQNLLTRFNEELEKTVIQKTKELQELNESLESKVIEKVAKITEQERLMITQSRLATMGEMMSMIAHQWRQPLSTTTLLITNERLKGMMAGDEPSECDMILEKISDTMVYLSDTIDDFQTYFKPDKASEKISVNKLVERLQHFIKPRLTQEKVKLSLEMCDEVFIETYANEVVQALINIVNNAIDVLVEKKSDERHIWIKLESNEESVSIGVEDNGGGVADDIIGRVFEPYFSSKSKNGTGLGLYMSKMIIEKHVGGILTVLNTSRGAKFTIVLPKEAIPVNVVE